MDAVKKAKRLIRRGICPTCYIEYSTLGPGEPTCPECGLDSETQTKLAAADLQSNALNTISLHGYHELQAKVSLLEKEKERLLDRCTNYANTVGRQTSTIVKLEDRLSATATELKRMFNSLQATIEVYSDQERSVDNG